MILKKCMIQEILNIVRYVEKVIGLLLRLLMKIPKFMHLIQFIFVFPAIIKLERWSIHSYNRLLIRELRLFLLFFTFFYSNLYDNSYGLLYHNTIHFCIIYNNTTTIF